MKWSEMLSQIVQRNRLRIAIEHWNPMCGWDRKRGVWRGSFGTQHHWDAGTGRAFMYENVFGNDVEEICRTLVEAYMENPQTPHADGREPFIPVHEIESARN